MKNKLIILVPVLLFLSDMVQAQNEEKLRKNTIKEVFQVLSKLTLCSYSEADSSSNKPSTYHSFTSFGPADKKPLTPEEQELIIQEISEDAAGYNRFIPRSMSSILQTGKCSDWLALENDTSLNRFGFLRYCLSNSYYQKGDTINAIKMINEAIVLNSVTEAFYLTKISLHFNQKEYEVCLTVLNQLLRFSTEKWKYHHQKYQILMFLNSLDEKNRTYEALSEISKAISELDKHLSNFSGKYVFPKKETLGRFYLARAELYHDLGETKKCCADVGIAVKLCRVEEKWTDLCK